LLHQLGHGRGIVLAVDLDLDGLYAQLGLARGGHRRFLRAQHFVLRNTHIAPQFALDHFIPCQLGAQLVLERAGRELVTRNEIAHGLLSFATLA
jgi:hypothetical protein